MVLTKKLRSTGADTEQNERLAAAAWGHTVEVDRAWYNIQDGYGEGARLWLRHIQGIIQPPQPPQAAQAMPHASLPALTSLAGTTSLVDYQTSDDSDSSTPEKKLTYDTVCTSLLQKRKQRHIWTDAETAALCDGVRQYGKRWMLIKEHYQPLCGMTSEQLKDKYRSLQRAHRLAPATATITDAIENTSIA